MIAGHVSFMFYPLVGIPEQVAAKRLRVLAAATAQHHPDYPIVPTMAESSFPGFERYTQGLGFLAPAGTPPAAESTTWLKEDHQRWEQLIKAVGVKAE